MYVKAHYHAPFMHTNSVLHCIFKVIILASTNISSLKHTGLWKLVDQIQMNLDLVNFQFSTIRGPNLYSG